MFAVLDALTDDAAAFDVGLAAELAELTELAEMGARLVAEAIDEVAGEEVAGARFFPPFVQVLAVEVEVTSWIAAKEEQKDVACSAMTIALTTATSSRATNSARGMCRDEAGIARRVATAVIISR